MQININYAYINIYIYIFTIKLPQKTKMIDDNQSLVKAVRK